MKHLKRTALVLMAAAMAFTGYRLRKQRRQRCWQRRQADHADLG